MIYRFLDFELDTDVFSLRRRGLVASVEPRVLDLVVYLIEQRVRMVPKNELIERVWHGQSVVPSVLPRAICIARRTLGGSHVIRTIHTRGYQWAATVTEGELLHATEPTSNRDDTRGWS